MRSSQTPENPANPDHRMVRAAKKKTASVPADRKTELAESLLSVNHKLDELTSANQDLFRMIDSATEEEPGADDSVAEEFRPTAVSEDEPTEPLLAYRLSSLLDSLRRQYGFEECAVFLFKDEDASLEKLVLSGSRAGDRGTKEFEDEVRALGERGDIARAVTERRRLIAPGRSGGSFLIIPLRILGRENGVWAVRFGQEVISQKKWSEEMPFWAELISACVENSHLKRLSAGDEKPYRLQTEKLFNAAEISRAVVHEINNCLQVILGRTQLLLMNEKKAQKAPSGLKFLETVETNANRICSILKDFSDHLHRQSGKSSGKGEVNIRRILESNLAFLQYILKSDRIRLEFDLGENLPPVCGDPGELELALLSLIWGLRDQLRAEGSIRVQGSSEANSLCLEILCACRQTGPDEPPDLADLESSQRFRLASELLNRHQGELKLERSRESEIHMSLTFPTPPAGKRRLVEYEESKL